MILHFVQTLPVTVSLLLKNMFDIVMPAKQLVDYKCVLQEQRNVIMEVVCNATQSQQKKVSVQNIENQLSTEQHVYVEGE